MKRSTVLTLNEPNIMMEKTLVILKPCTLQRGLVGEITNRFERKGLRILCFYLSSQSGFEIKNLELQFFVARTLLVIENFWKGKAK